MFGFLVDLALLDVGIEFVQKDIENQKARLVNYQQLLHVLPVVLQVFLFEQ